MTASYLRLLTLGFLAIAACGRRASDASPADTLTSASAPATRPSAATPFFEVLGHHAESAYDQVKLADWAAARASVDALITATRTVQPQDTINEGAELRASLASLDSSVTRRSRTQGLRDANYLTKLGAILSSGHGTVVPADVTMLDYYGRELEIWAEAKDTAKLAETASAIKQTWAELRPGVIERGGAAQALRFDSVVARVTSSRTPAQYGKSATPVLDQVDVLEAVFTK